MENNLWNKHQEVIRDFLNQYKAYNSKLLLACSGGVDSVYLFYLMNSLGLKFGVAHINYNLRGEDSIKDAKFVKQLAISHDIPIHLKSVYLNEQLKEGGNLQNLARNFRYAYFDNLIINESYDYVLLAHHLNDHVETILFNLANGAGLNGMKGIAEKRGKYLRPLLTISKEDIYKVMQERKYLWREDYTNLETNYKRNKIRNDIVPQLALINNRVLERVNFTSLLMREAQSIIEDYYQKWEANFIEEIEGSYQLDIEGVINSSAPYTLLHAFLQNLNIDNNYIQECEKLIYANVGSKVLTREYTIWRNRAGLYFEKIQNKKKNENLIIEKFEKTKLISIDEEYDFKFTIQEYRDLKSIAVMESDKIEIWNADRISWPLKLRRFRQGDKMRPFGMQSFKKLSKIFKDYKIENFNKSKLWLIEDQKEILSILFLRKSEKMRINSDCQFIMTIEIVNKN